jgi:hypothetical protein
MSYLLFLALTAGGMFAAVAWRDLLRVPELLADYLENRK